jgi:methylated-DNA-protein-cysteine methyltransferase related protein
VPPAPPPSPRQLDERILEVVARIPRGRVATYGEIAARAGLPRGARRVGRALRNLPARRKIPWHRVINAQGRIALAAGGDSAVRQRALLVAEGVAFSGDRIDLKRFGWTRPLDELLWAPAD